MRKNNDFPDTSSTVLVQYVQMKESVTRLPEEVMRKMMKQRFDWICFN